MFRSIVWVLVGCLVFTWMAGATPIVDTPFTQEYAEKYPVEPGGPGDDVRSIGIDAAGRALIATKGGAYLRSGGAWQRPAGGPDGPAFDVYRDDAGTLWLGAWDGIYWLEGDALHREAGVSAAIGCVGKHDGTLVALGPDGFFRKTTSGWEPFSARWSKSVRDTAIAGDNTLYAATHTGLFHESPSGSHLYAKNDEIMSTYVNAVERAPNGQVWVGGMGGVDVFEAGVRRAHYGTAEGLPNYNVFSITFDASGRAWIGTELGVVRFDGETWSLRHTRRWLPSDEVREVAFDAEGTAWIATSRGVGAIKTRTMTLADKADHFLEILRTRHVRTPGLVEKCLLPNPDDFSVWKPVDDDNDGSYTAMYMAMECFRYAVTKDPQAKKHADEAWAAIDLLHEVTGGQGFFARTVVPVDWPEQVHDGNETISDQEAADRRVDNPRYKKVEQRWRPSADGKWLWKGDTSSDEVVGHYYAFNIYYHLAADAAQKERVRTLIRRLTDYIIENDYTLVDPVTGSHTLWAVWTPERMQNDPEWRIEAPINSVEMLSFLRLAEHITGDAKYRREFNRLVEKYDFARHLRRPKSYGITERTRIDDDLLSMVIPTFVLVEKDPKYLALLREGYNWVYSTVEQDQNPFFNFTFAWAGVQETRHDQSAAFLRDAPLDLRQFAVDSSRREDVSIRRYPMLEVQQTERILPPSERGVMRWDKNPWEVFSGDFGDAEGTRESSGVYWLLPYWFGRYLEFIGPPVTTNTP